MVSDTENAMLQNVVSDTGDAARQNVVSDTKNAMSDTETVARQNAAPDTAIFIPFGIREIIIAPQQRMRVNGESVLLKGVCLHHDCGLLGSAYYDAAWRRRLLTLKSIGCNAIRTSHNPPAEEFLDLCDELGFYVIDECFDKWKSGYYEAHFDAEWQNDLDDFIMRDRNHPSVFLWSIGNEIHNQGEDAMLQLQKMLTDRVRALDERPVTCALAPHVVPRSLVGAPLDVLVERTKRLAQDVDVLGLNYHEALYQDYSAAINKPILGTECYEYYTSSASNFEDVFTKNPWRYVLENNNVLGQFIWAGIDYLGESSYPAKGWAGSILDICGFLKPNAYYRKSLWSAEPMVYLTFYDNSLKPDYARGRWSFPKTASHLNFEHFRREMVKAAIYTNCDEVELLINGNLMGRRRPSDFENKIIEWVFEYPEGEIKTIAYQNSAPVCTYTLKTAGPARDILLTPDTTRLDAGDIAHIEVRAIDAAGVLCPTEDALVEFALSGDGVILGASSPDLNTRLGYTLPKVHLYGGRALLLIRAGASAGTLELAAYSERLRPAALCFNAAPPDCS
jgi:beta-galactosidase